MKWIRVKDEAPSFKQGNKYLISDGKDISLALYVFANTGPSSIDWFPFEGFKCIDDVKLWMLLPELPTKTK